MQYHKIIREPESLIKFIDWLPELQKEEKYFLCLQARKKYMPSLKASDKTQLKRFASSKKTLYQKISQLECSVGTYRTKDNEIITDDAMVLYITVNPRNMRKATLDCIGAFAEMIKKHDANPDMDINPYAEALNVIHKSKSRCVFVDFEIDRPNNDETDKNGKKSNLTIEEAYDKVIKIVGKKAVDVIETRGGAHILIQPEKVESKDKNWYTVVQKTLSCDQSGDLMVPVVGCNQGGFVPKFYGK